MTGRPADLPARLLVLGLTLTLGGAACAPARAPAPDTGQTTRATCVTPGLWYLPGVDGARSTAEALDQIAGARVVLLGERHDRAEDHRWQLQTLAALQGRHPQLVIAFEMLPRSSQSALAAWSAGEMETAQFLEHSRWDSVWGYPAALYLPVLHFGRMNRLPMVALNVDASLRERVASAGWASIPASDRGGIGDPAPPSDEYRAMLESVFDQHVEHGVSDADASRAAFVDAQLLWDRAFAEGIRDALRHHPEAVVAALIGRGHLEYGAGVAHQLHALGIDDVATLLPWEVDDACAPPPVGIADAVFAVAAGGESEPRPRLGILIESVADGVVVRQVVADSVAARSGIRRDDVIVAAAGRRLATTGDLTAIVGRQPFGTILPLAIRRGGETFDLHVLFPPE